GRCRSRCRGRRRRQRSEPGDRPGHPTGRGQAMTATQSEPRTYRLSQLVRTGLFGSMPASQVIVLGIGGGLSFLGVLLRLFPWALLPALIAAVVAFKRVGVWSLHELIPLKVGWLVRRRAHRWYRRVPLLAPGER